MNEQISEQSKPTKDQLVRQGKAPRLVFNFWRFIRPSDGCWIWDGLKNEHGYGIVSGGKSFNMLAHRLSYAILKGEIPRGLYILHGCHTPACCNPEHLRPGTQADNVRDMYEAGRENNDKKLTDDQATQIRALEGKFTREEIGIMFGVGRSTVSSIFKGNHRAKTHTPHEVKKMSAKLDESKVRHIRQLLQTERLYVVAKQFSVTVSTLQAIRDWRTWKHVK